MQRDKDTISKLPHGVVEDFRYESEEDDDEFANDEKDTGYGSKGGEVDPLGISNQDQKRSPQY